MNKHCSQWKVLSVNEKISKTFHLVGAQLEDKIVLFGGHQTTSYTTYILSEEGELEQDLSHNGSTLIPGDMGHGAYSVQEGKIFAVGRTKVKGWWK